MGEDIHCDGAESLRELIETDKREAYEKFHGDDFPHRFARLHGGKPDSRPRPTPLLRGLIAAIPVMMVILAGIWLLLWDGLGSGRSPVGRDPVAAPLERVLSLSQAEGKRAASRSPILEASSGAKRWGERRLGALTVESVGKAEIRSTLFSEIISKFKEV